MTRREKIEIWPRGNWWRWVLLPLGAIWLGLFPVVVIGIIVQLVSLLVNMDLLHSAKTPTVLGPIVMFAFSVGVTFSACVIAPRRKAMVGALTMGILFAACSIGAAIGVVKGVYPREQAMLLVLDCALVLVGGGLVLRRVWSIYGFRN